MSFEVSIFTVLQVFWGSLNSVRGFSRRALEPRSARPLGWLGTLDMDRVLSARGQMTLEKGSRISGLFVSF